MIKKLLNKCLQHNVMSTWNYPTKQLKLWKEVKFSMILIFSRYFLEILHLLKYLIEYLKYFIEYTPYRISKVHFIQIKSIIFHI